MQYSPEPALFWWENMIAVGILLRVCWEILIFCPRLIRSNFLTFLVKRSTIEPFQGVAFLRVREKSKSRPRSRRRPWNLKDSIDMPPQ